MTRLSAPKRTHPLFARKPIPLRSQIKNLKKQMASNFIINDSPSTENEDVCNIKSRCSIKVYSGELLVDNEFPQVISLSSSRHFLNEEIYIPPPPKLPSPKDPSFNQIFNEKIKICNYIFNFSKDQFQIQGKKEKTDALIELHLLLTNKSKSGLLSSSQKDIILNMIKKNIFEQDPFMLAEKVLTSTLNSNFVDNSWEHLSLIFKILNKYVLLYPEKCEIDLVKKAIRLMNIPDSNERDCLVNFLKNYTKVHHNQFDDILKQLKSALINVRYDIYTPYCVDPIMTYITQQLFSNKMSISKILYTHLIPLFRHENLSLFFNKLISLVEYIVDSNFSEQLNVIQYLIKHFPHQCGQKQPLFVNALIIITKSMNSQKLNVLAKQLFIFIAMAVKSPNSKLTESALIFLMKPNMRPVILSNYDFVIKTLLKPIRWSAAYYWDKSVRLQSQDVLSLLTNAKYDVQSTNNNNFVISEQPNLNIKNFETKNRSDDELLQIWATFSRITAKTDKLFNLTKSLLIIKKAFQCETKEQSSLRRRSHPCNSNSLRINQPHACPLSGIACG